MTATRLHEDFTRTTGEERSSERSLGKVFGCVFAFIAGVKFYYGLHGAGLMWLGVAALFFVLAYAAPAVLRPLNVLWYRLSLLLFKIMNPIIMAIIFFTTFVPTGLLMRASGKDPMRMKKNPDAQSYWVAREPGDPAETMKNQF